MFTGAERKSERCSPKRTATGEDLHGSLLRRGSVYALQDVPGDVAVEERAFALLQAQRGAAERDVRGRVDDLRARACLGVLLLQWRQGLALLAFRQNLAGEALRVGLVADGAVQIDDGRVARPSAHDRVPAQLDLRDLDLIGRRG